MVATAGTVATLGRRRKRVHPRVGYADPQGLTMRGLRDRFEDAGHERAAAVGLHDLDLEALAGAKRVGTERRRAVHPASGRFPNLGVSLDSQGLRTAGYGSL